MDLQSRTQREPPFQVVESEEYTEQFGDLVSDAKLRDELQQTFDLYLPCDPSIFHEVPGTMLQAVTLVCAPPLTLFFHVDWNKRIITLVELHPF
jgi:hypothetical protein